MPHPERRIIECEEALRRLADFLDHELGEVHASEIEHHLEACRSCYSRAEFERRLKRRLRELSHASVDPEFESRICELTRGFTTS